MLDKATVHNSQRSTVITKTKKKNKHMDAIQSHQISHTDDHVYTNYRSSGKTTKYEIVDLSPESPTFNPPQFDPIKNVQSGKNSSSATF
jgi:hypothetical protein